MKKKLIALLLLTTAGLSACASSPDTDTDVLRVGMDLQFPPFSYLSEDGTAVGFEPIIAEAFAEYLGKEVEIVNSDFSLLIPALETGDVDILIADMSETPERAEKADFSDPYRYTQSLSLVNKEFAQEHNITDAMSAEDFFAIEEASFVGLAGTFGVVVPESYGVEVTEFTEIGNAILEVSNGTASAIVFSNEAHSFHAAYPDTTMVFSLGDVNSSSFVVPKGDTQLLEQSNAFIASMYEEGGFYDQIREEYDAIIADFLQNDDLGLDYIIYPPTK